MPYSVFNSSKCGIPPITPIPDFPFIGDCGVPEVPPVITDCPDIALPFPGSDGGPGPPGLDGEIGDPGLDGADGADGYSYEPVIAHQYFVDPVYVTTATGISVSIQEITANVYLLTFRIYIYIPHWFQECCLYLWCPPGGWHKIAGSDSCPPPCSEMTACDYELKVICPGCDSSSSSSSSVPPCFTCPSGLTVEFAGAVSRNECDNCEALNSTLFDLLESPCTTTGSPPTALIGGADLTGLGYGCTAASGNTILLSWSVECNYYAGSPRHRFTLSLADNTAGEAGNWEYRFSDGDDMQSIVMTFTGFNAAGGSFTSINNCMSLTDVDVTSIVTPTVTWTW